MPFTQSVTSSNSEITIYSLPIFTDNYVHILINKKSNECIAVDPGDADPVIKYLSENNLKLGGILLTHHHMDHIGGVQQLKTQFNSQIWAPINHKTQIPIADYYLKNKDHVSFWNYSFEVFELPGHTNGHILYYQKNLNAVFSGDILFGLGCGRVFDGTIEQHFHSIQFIKSLPAKTLIYCTHEYTELNIRFWEKLHAKFLINSDHSQSAVEKNLKIDQNVTFPDNYAQIFKQLTAAETTNLILLIKKLINSRDYSDYIQKAMEKRKQNKPTIPLDLGSELNCNPFLVVNKFNEFKVLRELRNQN